MIDIKKNIKQRNSQKLYVAYIYTYCGLSIATPKTKKKYFCRE